MKMQRVIKLWQLWQPEYKCCTEGWHMSLAKKSPTGPKLGVKKMIFQKITVFYQKLDFVIDREEIIDIGEGFVMDDYIMKYRLPC